VLLEHRGHRPVVPSSAYVAPSAVLCGAVTLGEDSRVLHDAVLTTEDAAVTLGANTVVMENALVRGRSSHPAVVGSSVLVGPHARVNGAVIEDEVFVATGACLFPGSVAGSGSELRIHSVPHVKTRLAPGTVVLIERIAAGDPAELFSPDRHDGRGLSSASSTSPAPHRLGCGAADDLGVPVGELEGEGGFGGRDGHGLVLVGSAEGDPLTGNRDHAGAGGAALHLNRLGRRPWRWTGLARSPTRVTRYARRARPTARIRLFRLRAPRRADVSKPQRHQRSSPAPAVQALVRDGWTDGRRTDHRIGESAGR
jgi:carbonic anhydrase/acetyltransferase-like protein (isoleucine patch superfamily)